MLFSTIPFLLFLSIVALLLLVSKHHEWRKSVLLGASLFFYGSSHLIYLALIAFVTIVSWHSGNAIFRTQNRCKKNVFFLTGIVAVVGCLAYFKYAYFIVGSFGAWFNADVAQLGKIVLPVGISFYSFQAISYLVDIRRANDEPVKNFWDYFLYIAFFPQLIAGPIVRASEFTPQLNDPIRLKLVNFVAGGQLFLFGYAQKRVLADNFAIYADQVFAAPELYATSSLWIGLFAYTGQIFCDFSGYSLMAIGLAAMLGFRLPQNFDMPYLSTSIAEFWRRWHMTLSFWLRDYIYISLGGNRKGVLRTNINLLLTMLIGGLWHGASWNFVIWGGAIGVMLLVHRTFQRTRAKFGFKQEGNTWQSAISLVATLGCVSLAWVAFRAENFEIMKTYYTRLFTSSSGHVWLHPATFGMMVLLIAWHLYYRVRGNLVLDHVLNRTVSMKTVWRRDNILITSGCIGFTVLLQAGSSSPFIYFQF